MAQPCTNSEFSGSRCTGASAFSGKTPQRYRARHTVLCAGEVHSPALLMRSGVGPADHLSSNGIQVVAALPGVGANLQNHPVVYLGAHLVRSGRQSPALRPAFNTVLRFSSSGDPAMRATSRCWRSTAPHGTGSATRLPAWNLLMPAVGDARPPHRGCRDRGYSVSTPMPTISAARPFGGFRRGLGPRHAGRRCPR